MRQVRSVRDAEIAGQVTHALATDGRLNVADRVQVAVEQGIVQLTGTVDSAEQKQAAPAEGESRWLRVRITDLNSGKASVNVNLPLGLVNVGLKMGARFIPNMEGIHVEELAEALRQGMTGKIIDVVDEEEGQRVEVYVE